MKVINSLLASMLAALLIWMAIAFVFSAVGAGLEVGGWIGWELLEAS